MNQRTKRTLAFTAAAIFSVSLVAITFNSAIDYWMPQVAVQEVSAPAVQPLSVQIPEPAQPLPAAPMPQPAAAPAEMQWNQPLFDPKFDGPGLPRNSGSVPDFKASDFREVLNQFAPLSQVLPPSVTVPGSDPAVVSIRPIFNSKAGGVDSGLAGAAGSVTGAAGSITGAAGNTVGGATSGAGSLLKR